MNEFMPFDDTEFADKTLLIHYFNEEQPDELINFAVALLALPKHTLSKVTLSDIGKTGLLLAVLSNQTLQTYFLPYIEPIIQRDDLQQQYILLLQKSAKILGKASIELKKRQFILLEKYNVTANMVRLVLKSEQDLSQLPAGYAFLLKTEISGVNQNRAVRYYTLRKAWQAIDEQGKPQNLAWIDVYCHGEKNGEISLGETWVKTLKMGDSVTSEREFPEKIDHLDFDKYSGQSLLIADETSLPTVARLLEIWQIETWQRAHLPIVLLFLQDKQDLVYLDNVLKQYSAIVLPIFADKNQSPCEQIFTALRDYLLNNPTQIHSVWGGLEAMTTKRLRPLLCDLLNLSREKMVLKVYWRNNE